MQGNAQNFKATIKRFKMMDTDQKVTIIHFPL